MKNDQTPDWVREKIKVYTGRISGFGSLIKKGIFYNTLLIRDIRNLDNEQITDHFWFKFPGSMSIKGFYKEGQRVRFKASVYNYTKFNGEHKFGLQNLKIIEIID